MRLRRRRIAPLPAGRPDHTDHGDPPDMAGGHDTGPCPDCGPVPCLVCRATGDRSTR